MFKIEELNPNIEAKTFKLSDRLFHEALKEEPESMARFHVTNDKGEHHTATNDGLFNRLSSVYAFHNVFFLQ